MPECLGGPHPVTQAAFSAQHDNPSLTPTGLILYCCSRPSTNSWLWHTACDCGCPPSSGPSLCLPELLERVIPPQPVELTSSKQTAQTHPPKLACHPVLATLSGSYHIPTVSHQPQTQGPNMIHSPCLSQDATRCFLHLGNPKKHLTSSTP